MKVVVIGQGSMGKRRVRCLKALGVESIVAMDPRQDRCNESSKLHEIPVVGTLAEARLNEADAVVISTPPDRHNEYMKAALAARKPAFIEASVILDGLEELSRESTKQGILLAPSCTMRFHPAIKAITEIVRQGRYGRWTGFSFHSGQYLPDWHPWENVKDFYVSNKATGAAREIVPFELTWLVDTLGFPIRSVGVHGATSDVGAAIDDTYACALLYANGVGTLTVDVTSRFATRSLILNLETAQVRWNWEDNAVRVFDVATGNWETKSLPTAKAHPGYNANIGEGMYIEEIEHFLQAVRGTGKYPSDLRDDIRVLRILYDVEHRTA